MTEPYLSITASLGLVAALFGLMWLISLRTRDVGAIDIVWGPGFALIAWFEWLRFAPQNLASVLVLLAVTLWATRLGVHLFVRHRMSAHEDARYAAMRAADPDRFWWLSLIKVFMLQAVILWLLALPIHLAMGAGSGQTSSWLTGLGLAIFLVGFALEAAADWTLLAFRKDPANRGRLVTSGPFAWSRHPNYFGECVLWFGIGLMAWDASGQALAMLGPVALSALILKVSGIPLLEDHLRRTRPEFAAYAARTNAFIPWPPRRGN
jgi:steroid 5-alpha reductase family enzyme